VPEVIRRLAQLSLAAADAEGLASVEAATIEEVWRELSPAEPQPAVPQDDVADASRGEPRFRAVRRLWG
jgi:hypothetical protein